MNMAYPAPYAYGVYCAYKRENHADTRCLAYSTHYAYTKYHAYHRYLLGYLLGDTYYEIPRISQILTTLRM